MINISVSCFLFMYVWESNEFTYKVFLCNFYLKTLRHFFLSHKLPGEMAQLISALLQETQEVIQVNLISVVAVFDDNSLSWIEKKNALWSSWIYYILYHILKIYCNQILYVLDTKSL